MCSGRRFIDSCLVDNGGCCNNAECSHEYITNAVKCSCKLGYRDVGSGSDMVCVTDPGSD